VVVGDPLAQLREDILVRYARVGPNGRPSRCAASAAGGGRPKVIFPTTAAATDAEQELTERTLSIRQDVYPCPYGPHFHLTKRRTS
jgi:hypothetical protein